MMQRSSRLFTLSDDAFLVDESLQIVLPALRPDAPALVETPVEPEEPDEPEPEPEEGEKIIRLFVGGIEQIEASDDEDLDPAEWGEDELDDEASDEDLGTASEGPTLNVPRSQLILVPSAPLFEPSEPDAAPLAPSEPPTAEVSPAAPQESRPLWPVLLMTAAAISLVLIVLWAG